MKQVVFVMIGAINKQILRDDVEAKVIFERAKEALRQNRAHMNSGDTFDFTTSEGSTASIKLAQLQMVEMSECVCPEWFNDFLIKERRRENRINRLADESVDAVNPREE